MTQLASTVPANGDVNPYGIAVVSQSMGSLVAGDTLVSNFNNQANVQGTGSTIVQVSPTGVTSTFATIGSLPASEPCPAGIGLTTALSVLPGGWVVVGSLAAGPGGALPAANPAGCLIVLNSSGSPVATWTGPNINGPWDMTAQATATGAELFVSNALTRPAGAPPTTGTCTIVRIDVSIPAGGTPTMTASTVIGSGFPWAANQAAFVLSPTGLALGSNGTLYVAGTPTNRVTSIPDALTRTTAVTDGQSTLTTGGGLNAPLGMTIAPNGDLLVANGGNGNVVEITPAGQQVVTATFAANGAGDLFGLTIAANKQGVLFVNDGTNALDLAAAASASSATPTPAGTGSALSSVGPAAATGLTVSLAKGAPGIYLIGPNGHALYVDSQDKGNVSACTSAACAKAWPALTATGTPTTGPGINTSEVATVTGQVANQVTYYGHLLYYFDGDTAPGQTSGTSITNFDLLGPVGNVMLPSS